MNILKYILTGVVALVFVAVLALTFSAIRAQDAETPDYRKYSYREWYLQGVWQVYEQNPDNAILSILFRLSDIYIRNYVMPNTGEDFETAKARIVSSLGLRRPILKSTQPLFSMRTRPATAQISSRVNAICLRSRTGR